jgi:hypothetical protein
VPAFLYVVLAETGSFGQRASGLRFDDPRAQAIRSALRLRSGKTHLTI